MEKAFVIGIAGGSGSGKSTFARRLKERFPEEIALVSCDNYYLARHDMPLEERKKQNYDSPEAFEFDLMIRQIRALKDGQPVDCPVYDFTVHNRSDETIRLVPKKVIIVEGILIFADEALRQRMDIRIFVDTDADVRLCRRIKRDVNKRGRSLESVLTQYQETVKPMHEMYVEPSKRHADLVVPEGGKNMVALDMILGRIQQHLEGASNP